MSVPPTRYRRVARSVERTFAVTAYGGAAGVAVCTLSFGLIVGYGFLTGALDASHPLAALDNSQVARFALAMNGFSMCVMNGSLVLYTLFRGIRDIRSGIVLVFGCAGFGFGAGLIELAGPVLTTVVP